MNQFLLKNKFFLSVPLTGFFDSELYDAERIVSIRSCPKLKEIFFFFGFDN